MRRRKFITLLGGAAAAWPLAANAQQPAMPVIGFLNGQSPGGWAPLVAAFRRGLNAAGYIEGQNVVVQYRWAEGQPDRLPALAADLVQRQVSVIVATGGNNPGIAAKAATASIPIVFMSNDDPRKHGLVASLNRPGGNVTGVSWFSAELGSKRLALLHELVPGARVVALLVNPNNAEAARQPAELQEAARSIGLRLVILNATAAGDIDTAFATMVQDGVGALVVAGDSFLLNRREQIIALAARHAVPTIYVNREMIGDGGLMSYGNSLADAYRRAGLHTARILKGENPADLPVDQATKFELVINLKTARTLGLIVPPGLLALADEVIEGGGASSSARTPAAASGCGPGAQPF
jgi:putative tryptophan/tyrosine transport system substrate-binding protein